MQRLGVSDLPQLVPLWWRLPRHLLSRLINTLVISRELSFTHFGSAYRVPLQLQYCAEWSFVILADSCSKPLRFIYSRRAIYFCASILCDVILYGLHYFAIWRLKEGCEIGKVYSLYSRYHEYRLKFWRVYWFNLYNGLWHLCYLVPLVSC